MDLRPDRLDLRGGARDLFTDDPEHRVVAHATVDAEVGPDRTLRRLEVTPALHGSPELLGLRVGGGFRAALDRLLSGFGGTPLALLLDDLPVAALISGYITLRTGGQPMDGGAGGHVAARMADTCIGWAASGSAVREIAVGRPLPVQESPPAPSLDADDPDGWHEQPTMPARVMRRRRRIDVWHEDTVMVDAMFRDSYAEQSGVETVLHEYTLQATVDPASLELLSISAVPHVLPFPECPGAADNVGRLVGFPVDELRLAVPDVLAGTLGCTHLNDLLRALGDVGALVGLLGSSP